MTHTLQQDFEHFLSYSGLSAESEDVKAKLLVAYTANWSVLGKGSQIQRLQQQRDSAVAELEEWIFTNKIDELQRLCDAKQAEIDRLMLEFCPDEMTKEQLKIWEESQRVVPGSQRIFDEYRLSNETEYSAAVAQRSEGKQASPQEIWDLAVQFAGTQVQWNFRGDQQLLVFETPEAFADCFRDVLCSIKKGQ